MQNLYGQLLHVSIETSMHLTKNKNVETSQYPRGMPVHIRGCVWLLCL